MNTVKILENKWIIRLFGFALIIAPIINIFILFYMMKNQNDMTWAQLPIKQILQSGQPIKYLMIFASIILGIIMQTGSTKVWNAVMALLFFHVVLQIPTIGIDIKQSWLWGPLFLINVGVLVFIADQLVFRNKTQNIKPLKLDQSTALSRKIIIDFENFGSWAYIKSISSTGFLIEQMNSNSPADIETKSVDLFLDSKISIQAHFQSKNGQEYFFKFSPLSSEQKDSLHSWLDRKSA